MGNVTQYEDIAFAPRNYGLSKKEVDARVNHALDAIDIQYLRNKQIYKMSGGEKKLVSIATILSMTPDVILMDEPSIALDPRNRRRLIQLLNSFSQIKIIASHDLDMILNTCERTILLSNGKIVCDGATKEILTNRQVLGKHGLELPLCLQKITKQGEILLTNASPCAMIKISKERCEVLPHVGFVSISLSRKHTA